MSVNNNIDRRNLMKSGILLSSVIWQNKSLPADMVARQSGGGSASPDPFFQQHPRLFYNVASLKGLRRWLGSNAAARHSLFKQGGELLHADFIPEADAEKGPGQQARFGSSGDQMMEMGLNLGVLYHLTGDKRYADKLRRAMFYYAQYTHWTAPSFFHRSPPWHSELDTSTFAFGYAAGYDALCGFLSDSDRKEIATVMVRKAVLPILDDWILPGRRIQSLDSMGHNWWGVCVSGAGLCALSLLGYDSRAQDWIGAIDIGFKQWFDYKGNVLQNRVATFEPSGPSYEGVGYTDYGVSQYLQYRLAWQNTFPGRKPADIERLKDLSRFFLHTLYPTSKRSFAVNFNDSGLLGDSTPTILLLIACGLGTPESSRYLELVHTHLEGTMLSLLRQYRKPVAATDVPTSYAYPKMGWAMMRTSWENDAAFLAVKSGYTWNHAHADAGTFMLFKNGLPLIIDSGLCSYFRPEYTRYYRQSRAHNVILFNGMGQPELDLFDGCKFSGHLHSMIDGLGLKYICADATGPMARFFVRNYRHWIWSGDVILIVDDVRAHVAGKLDWLLHFEGNYTKAPGGGVHLKNGAAEAVVKILYPDTKLSQATGLANEQPDKKVPYLVFSHDADGQLCQFVTAICLNPLAMPTFEMQSTGDHLSVRVRTADTVEDIYLDLRAIRTPGTIRENAEGYLTDAYLLHLTRDNSPNRPIKRYFMCDGSYLRHKDKSVIESLSKLTACWSSGRTPEIYSNDGSDFIQIAANEGCRQARWNGRLINGTYDSAAKLLVLDKREDANAAKDIR